MTKSKRNDLVISPIGLSGYLADLMLIGVGDGKIANHSPTRRTWHIFFFSFLIYLFWYVIIRFGVATWIDTPQLVKTIRLIECFIYLYLIISLVSVAFSHYKYMLLPKQKAQFGTLLFFLIAAIFLFARFYYSLYNYNQAYFQILDPLINEHQGFGIHGYNDFKLTLYCLNLSLSAMLGQSSTLIVPNSLLISFIINIETFMGFMYGAILISTFIQIQPANNSKSHK